MYLAKRGNEPLKEDRFDPPNGAFLIILSNLSASASRNMEMSVPVPGRKFGSPTGMAGNGKSQSKMEVLIGTSPRKICENPHGGLNMFRLENQRTDMD